MGVDTLNKQLLKAVECTDYKTGEEYWELTFYMESTGEIVRVLVDEPEGILDQRKVPEPEVVANDMLPQPESVSL